MVSLKVQKSSSSLLLLLFFLLVSFSVIFGVDRSKFRTCDQTSFCKRNRNLATGSSHHYIEPSTAQLSSTEFTANIVNPSFPDNQLKLIITVYQNGIFRAIIDEASSTIKQRYRVKDVLLDHVVPTPLEASHKSNEYWVLKSSSGELRIQFKPFKIEALENGVPVISANERGLFHFEHYRLKSSLVQEEQEEKTEENVEKVEGQDENSQQVEDDEEAVIALASLKKSESDGSWEEHFGSHKDSKPFGPSSIGLDLKFVNSAYVYGIPEHATNLALKPTKGDGIISDPYRLYNLDVFEYELDQTMALYGSVPFMIGHSEQSTVGVFWLNPSETWVDVENSNSQHGVDTHWLSESGVVDIFFLLGSSPSEILEKYAFLTGTTALPPIFSIAYHQCRWNYKSEDDVRHVDAGFDEHDIPYDVLWLDIEHTDGKRYFTWDKTYFPTPELMQEEIAKKSRKMVTIVDPHIKRDSNYFIHSEAQAKGNVYVKNEKGEEYEGWCWPGSSSWVDYVNPEIRDWWATKFSYSNYQGSTNVLYTWNDMNEPSVFNGPEVSMHKDAKHFGDLEHREIHNMYGFYMQMATAQGLISRNEKANERPFVLSRAIFAGTQRYGAIWTGDNTAQWGHLEYSTPMLLSLGLAGITFSGGDVGGFFGNPSAQLTTRWYQAASFQPFFRGHAHLDTKRREPWLFGEPYTGIIRHAIRTRYQLLPFWYTIFYQNYLTGLPLIRPLWFEFPKDKTTFTIQDQFLVGSSLLVKPIAHEETFSTQVYLPGDQLWYEYGTSTTHSGSQTITVETPLEKIPVFQRGGTIITRKDRVRRSASLMQEDPFTLIVALNNKNEASGELYVDDGHSFDFTRGSYLYRKFNFQNSVLENSILGDSKQNFQLKGGLIERVVIYGWKTTPSKVTLDSKTDLTFEYDSAHHTLVLRKPDLHVGQNWKVTIS